jgi:hypothetical protein
MRHDEFSLKIRESFRDEFEVRGSRFRVKLRRELRTVNPAYRGAGYELRTSSSDTIRK